MILKKIDRTEMIRQLKLIDDHYDCTKSKMIIATRENKREIVYGIGRHESVKGLFLCSAPEEYESFSKLMNVTNPTIPTIISELEKSSDEEIWFGYPREDPHAVIGKLFAISNGDEVIVYALPVPDDIEYVNEEVRMACAQHCQKAKDGLQCGECPDIMNCDIIKKIDDEITKERNG